MDVPKKYKDRLKELKKTVEMSYVYFRHNQLRYQDFMKFVFDSALSSQDKQKLQALQKPALEFNILESVISRLRGEFAQQEPSVHVKADDGVSADKMTEDYLEMMKVLESHIRALISDSTSDGLQFKIITDLLGGGYSVAEIYTDYLNDLSFDQKICVKRVFDPTLTGFDPLARESHKGDGQYCFQLFPWSRERFEEEFGAEKAERIKFSKGVAPFSWSYNVDKQDILVICEYFEKKHIKKKIVKLTSGHVVTKEHYQQLLKHWEEQGFIEQPPQIIMERMTELETIVRYRFCETEVLSREETSFRLLPLVFIDGNSIEVRSSEDGNMTQMTRPYAYQAKGIQQLLNYAGQTIGADIENIVQHKFKASIESVPEDYQDAYRNVQQASILLYNAFYKNDPQVPLEAPQEIVRTPLPPIVENIFMGSDRMTQTILGSYDNMMASNQKDVSGVAIANGAIQSSAASAPYLVGYIHGLNRIAQVLLDLIPKIYTTPRTIPIVKPDGKRSYQLINYDDNEESIDLDYKANDLHVQVEAGVNTQIQKQIALDQIIRMMQASELFASFVNSQGLEILLDNMDIRGIEEMKVRAGAFMKQQAEMQEQQAQQGDPMQEMIKADLEVKMAQVEQQKEKAEGELAVATAKVAMEREKTQAQVAKIMSDIELEHGRMDLDMERAASDDARDAIDTALRITKEHHERAQKQEK